MLERSRPGLLSLAFLLPGAAFGAGCNGNVASSPLGAGGSTSATGSTGTTGTQSGTHTTGSAATSSGTGTTGTSGTSSGTGTGATGTVYSTACDVTDCATCQDCANSMICGPYEAACAGTPECNAIQNCSNVCHDLPCIQDCIKAHPAGTATFNAIVDCITCSCKTSCSEDATTCP